MISLLGLTRPSSSTAMNPARSALGQAQCPCPPVAMEAEGQDVPVAEPREGWNAVYRANRLNQTLRRGGKARRGINHLEPPPRPQGGTNLVPGRTLR